MHSPFRRSAIRVGALLTAGAATLALVSCSSGDAAGDGPVTITFSYLWGGTEAEAIEKVIAEFNASQDGIVVEGISSPDTQGQLTSMSAAKGTFDISDNWGSNVGAWASTGILEPLDEYLEANGVDTGDFVPAAMDQMTYEGALYSMPIAIHSFQLVYNKAILDEAGVAVPTTMDELSAAIEALTVQSADGSIERVGLGDPSVPTTLTTLGFNFGGVWDADGAPTPTDPGNIAALEWYQENVVDGVGASNLSTFKAGLGEYLSAEDPFYTGKYAMVIDGEWRAINAATVAPELDWGVTAIPYASSDLQNVTQTTSSTLFIPANSQHKEEAGVFLSYLVGADGMEAFARALGNLPSRLDLLDSSAFDDIAGFSVWMDALKSENVFSLSTAPYSVDYASDLAAGFDEIVRGVSTPEEAMEWVQGRTATYAAD